MRLLNFSHPLTDPQREQLRLLVGRDWTDERQVATHFDGERPYAEQAASLIESLGISPDDWQTVAWLIVPPAFAPITGVLLAELHGRMGYFPPLVRLTPVTSSNPPQFEVAEVIDLNAVRQAAREHRTRTT